MLQLDGKEQSDEHKVQPSPSSTWQTPSPHDKELGATVGIDDGEDVGFNDGLDEGWIDKEGSDDGVWLDVGIDETEGANVIAGP